MIKLTGSDVAGSALGHVTRLSGNERRRMKRCKSVPCVPRSVDAIWGVRHVFYLLINRSYIPIPSLHRAREMN